MGDPDFTADPDFTVDRGSTAHRTLTRRTSDRARWREELVPGPMWVLRQVDSTVVDSLVTVEWVDNQN